MIAEELEKKFSWMVAVGMAACMLMVTTFMSMEPVNTPKALVLIPLGIASWFGLIQNKFETLKSKSNALLIVFCIFSFFTVLNVFMSASPVEQTLYGAFGRSTGAATYFSLIGVLGLVASFTNKKSIQKIVTSIFIVGIVNLIYCGVDIIGPDILGWNNIYGEILGTFGNPNFIGAFFGIFGSLIAVHMIEPGISKGKRFTFLILYILTLIEIYFSKAYQGMIVYLLGTAISIYFWIRTSAKFQRYSLAYFLTILIGIITCLFGIFDKGPLRFLLSKSSISYRGVYWETGISVGKNHPLTGIGFDAFGDYYREFRPAHAIISPGPAVVTNSAHNVPIDLLAAGGFPLLFAYLFLMIIGVCAVIQIMKNMKSFDVVGISLIVTWIGYQVQSLISINQIGLAVCGWVLTGAVVAYSKILSQELVADVDKGKGIPQNIRSYQNAAFPAIIGFLIGLILAIPPFFVDAEWRSSLNKGDGEGVSNAALHWPKDSYRMTQIAIALEQSGLMEQSVIVARESTKFNPRYFDSWKVLAQVTKSTPEEKAKSIEMMHKLDPLNTELK